MRAGYITESMINDLIKEFRDYTMNEAEVQEFLVLALIDNNIDATLEVIKKDPDWISNNQKEIRSMFRVILRAMHKDCSQYTEKYYEENYACSL